MRAPLTLTFLLNLVVHPEITSEKAHITSASAAGQAELLPSLSINTVDIVSTICGAQMMSAMLAGVRDYLHCPSEP
jgi:hypothetical protein